MGKLAGSHGVARIHIDALVRVPRRSELVPRRERGATEDDRLQRAGPMIARGRRDCKRIGWSRELSTSAGSGMCQILGVSIRRELR